ncbi:MAG: D-alanine--D-alanine ligase [Verrucomicrobia bacterium]|nr:D-alanine--D-alanine ligase [Verrucomicrobiota bacterium]
MTKYKKVAVLMGGPSAEREVSLRSGAAVAEALRQTGHDVHAIDVTGRELHIPSDVDAVFIALHGTYGEDGAVQAELTRRGMPFTGPGEAASRIAFDKELTKHLAATHGIPTAPYEVLRQGDARALPVPLVVKPARQGSSIGVHPVFTEAQWPDAFADALRHDDKVIAEAFIPGREFTVGVLDETLLSIVEIVVENGWYDYETKYVRGANRYLVPAPLTASQAAACHGWARRTYDAAGCRGMSRIDFRMTDAGDWYLLEINTIPGFTDTSLLPKAAAQDGLPFPALCERVLSRATV